MRSSWFRVLAVVVLGSLSSGSAILRAQSALQTKSVLADRCIRWLQAIVPDQAQDRLNPTDFCRGYPTGNVDGLWSNCKTAPGQQYGRCGFQGKVLPADTLAFSLITPSRDGHEFLDPEAKSGFGQGTMATLYSRTDFVVDGTKLRAGLYRIFPHKSGEDWEMNFALLEGEWNDPGSPSEPVFHARMKIIEDVQPTEMLVDQMWISTKHCEGSGISSLREFEFRFRETDVSLCVNVLQSPPPVQGDLSEH